MPLPTSSEHAEAVLRVIAYHRRDLDHTVTRFSTGEHTTVRTSLLSTSLGILDSLPIELIDAIFLELDMSSLFTFHQVDLRAQQIMYSRPQYRIVVTHSLDYFCAIFRTKAASFVMLKDYYRRLCETTCSICEQNYSNFIHLLEWMRCCSACLRKRAPQLHVLTSTAA
nr:hypothetical protein CFP56_03269 [Quercus suber]